MTLVLPFQPLPHKAFRDKRDRWLVETRLKRRPRGREGVTREYRGGFSSPGRGSKNRGSGGDVVGDITRLHAAVSYGKMSRCDVEREGIV